MKPDMTNLIEYIHVQKKVILRKLQGHTTVKDIPDHIRGQLYGELAGYNKILKKIEQERWQSG